VLAEQSSVSRVNGGRFSSKRITHLILSEVVACSVQLLHLASKTTDCG
jgi:hypothetical protein